MKRKIFYFLWAVICAWLFVKLLLWVDFQFELTQTAVFAPVVDFIHKWDLSVRKVLFCVLVIVFLITGIQNYFGHWLLTILGIAIFLFVAMLVIYLGWTFLAWISSLL